MTLVAVQDLYNQGKFRQAMDAVWGEVNEERGKDDPEIGKLKMIRAWCHWRLQEWDDAREWLQGAEEAGGAELEAKRLRAYFAAYRDKNDAVLGTIAKELPDDVSVQNALVIRARDKDSILDHASVLLIVICSISQTVEVANLFHNGARFFLAKAQNQGDLEIALALIGIAIIRYGSDDNWHHRAAAFFWKSHIYERLGYHQGALHAAEQSLFLWNEAVDRDPQNKGFQKGREGAIARIAELQ